MNASNLPAAARSSGDAQRDLARYRVRWRLVHLGFYAVFFGGLVAFVTVALNASIASLTAETGALVPLPLLLSERLPPIAGVASSVLVLAWLVVLAGLVVMSFAPAHPRLRIYASLGAVTLAAGLFVDWLLLVSAATIVFFVHALARCWHQEALRRHAVVLLVALGLLAVILIARGTPFPAGMAFNDVIHGVHHDLPFGAVLTLMTVTLPWVLWGIWFLYVLWQARTITRAGKRHGVVEAMPTGATRRA